MASTGFEFNSAFSHGHLKRRVSTYTLYRDTSMPTAKEFTWINFWFGTSYTGSSHTKTLSDTYGGGATDIAY